MPTPPQPLAPDLLSHWSLDPSITFLNHGSFGACPDIVLEAQRQWRARIEARPIEMLERKRDEFLSDAAETVAAFVGAREDDLVFVTNATDGINGVLRSLTIKPGDELLTTNHVYNAIRRTMFYVASRAGATYTEVDIPLPVASAEKIVETIENSLSNRTRLLVIDHISSPTAIVFPVERIVNLCREHNVDVLIDGAHTPGMVDLDLQTLNPAYYAANLHKWVCAPKGSAFLWVRPDRQAGVHPTTISHFLDQGFKAEFGWQGTRDITPWLCAPDAIDFLAQFGCKTIRAHNHQLAVWVQAMLCERWNVEPASPRDGSMLGAMTTVALPERAMQWGEFKSFQAELYARYNIEVPVVDWGNRWWVRPCCQIYNQTQQYEQLAEAVEEFLSGLERNR